MDDALARQRRATYRFWREDVSVRPGGEWADLDGVQVHTTGLAPRHWNGAFLTRPTDLDRAVVAASEWFEQREKPWGLLIPLEAAVAPPRLEHALDQPVMLHDLADLPPVELPLRDDAPPADVAAVQAEAFQDAYDVVLAFVTPTLSPQARPPQRTLTAYEDGVPVGCATVAMSDGVAGVYGVAVVEAARGRGLGTALTAACLRLARAAGCDLAYLNPSPMAYGVYRRLGFEDAAGFGVWVLPD